ncbi:hypothetical protein [Candidatus Electronema sp. PJ]|uniref:hypothetical protein n=1 Tax=Candidatus Electronema sp. PJ TaxID=3401572 RepID=UPI003AA8BA31
MNYSEIKAIFLALPVKHRHAACLIGYLILIITTYTAFILLFSLAVPIVFSKLRIFSLLTMLGWASAFAGAFVGFMFGIPRVGPSNPEKTDQKRKRDESSKESKAAGDKSRYRVNTNLEVVSDWLTKILVGAGLTQLHNTQIYLRDISRYFAQGLEKIVGIQQMITAIIILHMIVGLLGGYLLTRIYLTGVFAEADKEMDQEAPDLET